MAQGVTASAYEKQLVACFFLSQAFESDADRARFHRSTSPEGVLGGDTRLAQHKKPTPKRKSWFRELYNFNSGKQDDPVDHPACHC